jgi:hypothetical protein
VTTGGRIGADVRQEVIFMPSRAPLPSGAPIASPTAHAPQQAVAIDRCALSRRLEMPPAETIRSRIPAINITIKASAELHKNTMQRAAGFDPAPSEWGIPSRRTPSRPSHQ